MDSHIFSLSQVTSLPFVIPLQSATECVAEREKAVGGNERQHDRNGLAKSNRPGNRGATENDGREKGQFDAVGLLVLDPIASERVCHQQQLSTMPRENGQTGRLHKAPTVTPAMMLGLLLVRAKPTMPPVAVRAARTNAGKSRED